MPLFAVHLTECIGCIFSSFLAFLRLFKAQWEAMGMKYVAFNHFEEGEGRLLSLGCTKSLLKGIIAVEEGADFYWMGYMSSEPSTHFKPLQQLF